MFRTLSILSITLSIICFTRASVTAQEFPIAVGSD